MLLESTRLLQSMVDVVASNGWLSPALAAMEVSQMVTQGLWDRDPPLMQVPHFTRQLCQQMTEESLESVFDLVDMDAAKREALLKMSEKQLSEVDQFCRRYPDVQLNFEVLNADVIRTGDPVSMTVLLERDIVHEDTTTLRPVDAPRYVWASGR